MLLSQLLPTTPTTSTTSTSVTIVVVSEAASFCCTIPQGMTSVDTLQNASIEPAHKEIRTRQFCSGKKRKTLCYTATCDSVDLASVQAPLPRFAAKRKIQWTCTFALISLQSKIRTSKKTKDKNMYVVLRQSWIISRNSKA